MKITEKFTAEEFYPTPVSLLDEITTGIQWRDIQSVLEPSAGKGDIAEYIREHIEKARRYSSYDYDEIDIDCIEIDPDLRSVLTGKELRVVHDDFLTYNTFKKYDLIAMNPPFSAGAKHLLKALNIQKHGGSVLCILNAETIRNPYTNERKDLVRKLEEYEAEISFLEEEFCNAERSTSVEIAVVKCIIPESSRESIFFDDIKKKHYAENSYTEKEMDELAPNDYIEIAVRNYNIELEAGLKLIREYQAIAPHIKESLRESTYNKPLLELKVGGKELSVNRYVRLVREKYWEGLFKNPKFVNRMTSEQQTEYSSKIRELRDYDFSMYNINEIQLQLTKNVISSIEETIIKLFDELSYQYSYSDELSKNIHYYNGWKTNKSWYINKKVIIPHVDAFRNLYNKFRIDYEVSKKLRDIEKALNYLDGGLTNHTGFDSVAEQATREGQTKNVDFKYFKATFYKKGTCHIEFKDMELLKKLNIFGSQQKGWLPPSYGKKKYSEMTEEERTVVDEFEGEEAYNNVLRNTDYYLCDVSKDMLLLDKAV